ncbi:hypothetical protein Tco_0860242 [Tanacetum coccineum]|uniref:RNA-directed DNA polymerase, eukaryota, Reverse transcriptase zinc-binding domain protein n=1 Tax=Tanacetum coccineum TaxID=301880 RepID=A0ABQ5BEC7_9ASTR
MENLDLLLSQSAFASVLINGSPTKEFKVKKGLRQGDPSHHFSFHMQLKPQCAAPKRFLKIIFHKSKLYGVGVTTLEVNSLASMIGCLPSKFPCTYLGLPIGGNMSRCANWGILVDKFNERLSNWKAMSLSFWWKIYTIKSVLATSPISNGGLGIGTLKSSNLAMLSKWWWRFHTENHAFWCKIIRSIHGVDGGLNDTSLIKSKSGPWYRIAKLKDELNNLARRIASQDSFPMIISVRFKPSAWPIRSNLELCELLELCSLVAHLHPSDNGDSWECIIDDSRSFSVKRMRSFINQVSPTLQRFENRQDDYSALAETHEECLETVWKLVTARQDLEHNATLYTIMSNHFK